MKRILSILFAFFFLATHSTSFAEYPKKPVSVIIPYGAGGGTDTQARLLLKYVEDALNKSMVVINRPGAGGEIGLTQLSKSRKDGYTLGVIAYPDALIRTNYMDTQYNMDDFIYLAAVTNSPVVFLSGPSSPYKNLETLVEETKKNNKTITVAIASDAHYLTMKMFSDLSGIKFTPVFFKSGSAALNAVIGGHIDTAAIAVQFGVVGLDSGANILAVADEERVKSLPQIKTFKEQNYDVVVRQSRILIAPKDIPSDVLAVLEQASKDAVLNEELKSRIDTIGEVYDSLYGEKMKELIKNSEDIITPIVKASAQDFVSGQQ